MNGVVEGRIGQSFIQHHRRHSDSVTEAPRVYKAPIDMEVRGPAAFLDAMPPPPRHDVFLVEFVYDGAPPCGDIEVVPALHGRSVYEALEPALYRRKLTMDGVQLFLEKSSTPLPPGSPAICLGGCKLFVR
uniref:RBD domain-containing protein n=1 Tax=Plectus sambesii TaxID=2011161 RepID=A0A914V6N2_9BILA